MKSRKRIAMSIAVYEGFDMTNATVAGAGPITPNGSSNAIRNPTSIGRE